jgi:hypothetical protein
MTQIAQNRLVMLRRSVLICVAVCVVAAFVARAQESPRVTLDDFVDVSERLLRASKLDRETAKIYLDALNADADTAVTLEYVVQSNGNPTPEQKVLSATIIRWWRTGVYELNGESRLAARSRAVWSSYPTPLASGLSDS